MTAPFVDAGLAYRLEIAHAWRSIHYARAQAALRPATQSALEAVAGGYAVHAGSPAPVNKAVGLGLHGPVDAGEVGRIEQFYRSRASVPAVEVCPLAHPSLLRWLGQRPYRLEQFFSVLALSLHDWGAWEGEAAPAPGVRVSRVGPEDAELWLRTVAQGFEGRDGLQDDPSREMLDVLAPNYHSAVATCFLAWVDGQPAGGGAMAVHEGVVELGGASTRPAFRHRGVQAALIHARLSAARAAGCDLALVLATPGSDSQRNVERAGFRLAYTKVVVGQRTNE